MVLFNIWNNNFILILTSKKICSCGFEFIYLIKLINIKFIIIGRTNITNHIYIVLLLLLLLLLLLYNKINDDNDDERRHI